MLNKCPMLLTVAYSLLLAVPCRTQETPSTNSHSWTNVFEGKLVHFVRIEYAGEGWDDGMDSKFAADMNLLNRLHDLSGVPVATNSESMTIRSLRYGAQNTPPVAYITGSKSIRTSMRDVTMLREYLLKGGMLFADCGSPEWHESFLQWMCMVLPDKRMVKIADDDPLFREPYLFPNGAPPMTHHGGMKTLGYKHEERWIVVYHPGDINDAWKTENVESNATQAEAAFRLGINVIYYAWKQNYEMHKAVIGIGTPPEYPPKRTLRTSLTAD